jgi:hypothetical protein
MTGFFHSSRFHLLATAAWLVLLAPTLLWWRESVAWIVLMSWYANFIGHISAYQAARAEEHSS